jgi:hypothetical protein
MYIQQVRIERRQVTDSDGRTRTEAVEVPVVDAYSLCSAGQTYLTHGNGVFHVPDALGASLVGGLFRDVTEQKQIEKAKIAAPLAPKPPEPEEEPHYTEVRSGAPSKPLKPSKKASAPKAP